MNQTRFFWLFFFLISASAILYRFPFIQTLPFDSDQAIVGLMAKHITKGEFPLLYYGDSYGGILEPALTSIAFHLFGVSRFTLHLVPFLFSILFILSIFQLGRELYNLEIGLLSMLLAAVPPYIMQLDAAMANGGYIETLWLGNLILLYSHRIANNKISLVLPRFQFFWLGILWGIVWWTYPISLIYLMASFTFLSLQKREFIFRARIIIAAAGFLLGSLPFWIWNTKFFFPFFRVVQSPRGISYLEKTMVFLTQIIQIFGLTPRSGVTLLGYFFSFLFLASILFLIVKKKWLKIKFPSNQSHVLLLLYLFFFILLYIGSGFSERDAFRYLLPLYSLFPICLALFFYFLKTKSRPLSIALMISFLLFNCYQNPAWFSFFGNTTNRNLKQAETETVLFDFLKKKKINQIYDPAYWSAARLTFSTKENLIFARPFNDRYPLYTLMADASSNTAFVLEGMDRQSFEEMFKVIGGTYQRQIISLYPGVLGYAVYYDFRPPEVPGQEILPVDWKGKSNSNSGDLQRVFDRNISTHWTSARPQEKGMFLQIDLGKSYPVNRIILQAARGREWDFPKSYRLEVSPDLRLWQDVGSVSLQWAYLFWSLDHPIWKLRDGRIEIPFEPRETRFIKLTLTDNNPLFHWSIGEIFVYQRAEPVQTEKFSVEELVSFLYKKKIKYIYADLGISARITHLTKGKIKCLQDDYDMTNAPDYFINGYNEPFPYFNQLKKRVDFSLLPAFVVKRENNQTFAQTIQKLTDSYQVKVLGDYLIYYRLKIPEAAPIGLEKGLPSYYWTGTHLLKMNPPTGARDEG